MTSKIAAFTAGGGVEAHSSNSTLPFCKRWAEPAKKEKTGASLSTHTISAGLRCLVNIHDGNATIAGRSGRSTQNKRAGLQDALIAVVKQEDVERPGGGGADNVGVVLGAEPIDGIDRVGGSGLKSKVALKAELPKN